MTKKVCVIDIGTVTARAAYAEVDGSKILRLAKSSAICNLGQGIDATHELSDEGISKVLGALDQFLPMAAQFGAELGACVMTSATRDAENAYILLAEFARRGIEPDIISGDSESALSFYGVAADFENKPVCVIDLGGGSCEFACGTLGSDAMDLCVQESIDMGARRLTDRFKLMDGPVEEKTVATARAHAKAAFAEVGAKVQETSVASNEILAVCVGGTATSAVAMDMQMKTYDASKVHLAQLTKVSLEKIIDQLAKASIEERKQMVGLQPERASVMLGGCICLSAIMDVLAVDSIRVSESDLLFGLVKEAGRKAYNMQSMTGFSPKLSKIIK